jgi:hypothetical protein
VNDLDPRRRALWGLLDFSSGQGLEIGPLNNPMIRKDEAAVRYVDIQDQAGLRAYYEGHAGVPVDDIPEIDFPLTQPDGRIASLVEATKAGAPFDWAVASHVVEHIPDLIGWLGELGEVVVDGGALVLIVPDRRYCFDFHRPPTSVGAMLEAHLLEAVRPGARAVYDHYSRAVQGTSIDLWHGMVPDYTMRFHSLAEAENLVEESLTSYVDSHVWLFTPAGFVEQLHELRLIGRSPWYVEEIRPTPRNDVEFMVRLRRLPRGSDSRGPVEGELLPTNTTPDWFDDPVFRTRVRRLRTRVRGLRRKLARRRAQVKRLRAKTARQQKVIARQRAELERLRSSGPVRIARKAAAVRGRLRRQG